MEIKDSSDAFRLIHNSLARWVEGGLENGFECDPVDRKSGNHLCDDFILMAERMRAIEAHTDIDHPPTGQ